MNRTKHGIMLGFKVLFIILCFVVVSVFTTFKNTENSPLNAVKGKVGLDSCEILVFDAAFEESGASLTYEIQDGKIVFDLVQSGKQYDDVCVLISYPDFTYDAGAMREYLYDTLGDDAEQEEDYLKAMEEGPWKCNYSFGLTGDVKNPDSNKVVYTLCDPFEKEHTAVMKAAGQTERTRIDDIYTEKGEELLFMLIFGSEREGALPSGQYVFEADLGVSGLYDEDVSLSFSSTIGIITSIFVKTIKDNGFGIFNVESWLTFYGAMIVTGMFIYLWRDLRSLKKIFGAMLEERHPPVRVIVKVYVDGYVTDEYSYLDNGSSMVAAFIVTLLCYVFFLLTYPLRILVQIIRDIVYLIRDDDEIEAFSYLGNIMGSVGVYVLVAGIVGFMGASTVLGIIGTVLGLGLCIGAHFICKRHEEEYA